MTHICEFELFGDYRARIQHHVKCTAPAVRFCQCEYDSDSGTVIRGEWRCEEHAE